MKEVLRIADALEFVESLPDWIDTQIGEKATGISEGQAQRLSIARALLKKSAVLILDEATSALDDKTEMKILDAIERYELPDGAVREPPEISGEVCGANFALTVNNFR